MKVLTKATDKAKSFADRMALSDRAIAAAHRAADVAGEAPGMIQQAGQSALAAIRMRGSQGLAGAMGQAGRMVTGGGQAASLRQAGLEAASMEGAFSLDQAKQMLEAKQNAAIAKLEALKFEKRAGDPWALRKEAINFFTTELSKMKMSNMSYNDIKAMIDSWIEVEDDPNLVNWLQRARLSTFAGHRRDMAGHLFGGGKPPAEWKHFGGLTEEQVALYPDLVEKLGES